MLKITIPGGEMYNEEDSTFHYTNEQTLKLEHSLLAMSKWEAKWMVPFLHDDPLKPKTSEMILDYIKFMTINSVPKDTYDHIPQEAFDTITEYINSKQTATTFSDEGTQSKQNKQIITSELIYYWMAASQIPFECEKWHINRLLTLIRIYSIHNDTSKDKPKIGKKQAAMSRAELNAKRKAMYNTKG